MAPPVIDISPWLKNRNEKVTQQIRDACSEWGFFQCTGHGIDEQIIQDFDRKCRTFFEDTPRPSKLAIKRTATNSRGWFDDELTKRRRDWKECFDFGREGRSDIDGENQWPADATAPGFREAMETYFAACEELSSSLLSAMAVGLGKNFDHFKKDMRKHTSYLRLNYYPVCEQEVAPASHGYEEPEGSWLGINKHTDAGVLTILRQYHDEPSSLQVWQPDRKQWFCVEPVKEALTINIGDMLQVWSNDQYRAPIHRVLANTRRKRFSAPVFFNPAYDTVIAPIDNTGEPRYEGFTWSEFRRRRFEGDFENQGSEEVQIKDWRVPTTTRSFL